MNFINTGAGKYPEVGDNNQRVIADGIEIGEVWQQWFRLGGDGWTNSLVGSSGFTTRKEAAQDLLRRFNLRGK